MAQKSPSTSTSFPATAYPDHPIDPQREIRLVTIRPGKRIADIECTLSTHRLDLDDSGSIEEIDFKNCNSLPHDPSSSLFNWRPEPAREYSALSYCWGGFEDHGTLRLDDISNFPVSRNLSYALKRLRSKQKKGDPLRRYWIDQLCINQHDILERNQQVKIMAQIFHQAFRVHIWLFDTPEESAPSLLFTRHRRTKILMDSISQVPANLSWWERAWVTQEFLVARYPPSALYGPCEVEWNELSPRPDRDSLYDQFSETKLSSAISRLYNQSISLRVYGKIDMDEYFQTMVTTKCFDPRDKVYSLLGLINGLDKVIRPDYEKALPALFTEVTRAAIECSGSLDIFATIVRCDTTREEMTLPTWVVNFAVFSDTNDTTLPQMHVYRDESRSRKASAWCHMDDDCTTEVSFPMMPDRLSLKFKGLYFDNVFFTFPLGRYWTFQRQRDWKQAATDFTKGQFRDVDLDVELERYYNPSRWGFLAPLFDLGNPYIRLGNRKSLSESTPTTDQGSISSRIREETEASQLQLGVYDIVHLVRYWRDRFLPEDKPERWEYTRGHVSEWRTKLDFTSGGYSLFTTPSGFIGIGPKDIQEGDEIVLPFGCQYPLVLTKCDDGVYKFKCVALVEGIMYGKLAEQRPPIRLREGEWTLI